jgi:hypothetical protein
MFMYQMVYIMSIDCVKPIEIHIIMLTKCKICKKNCPIETKNKRKKFVWWMKRVILFYMNEN